MVDCGYGKETERDFSLYGILQHVDSYKVNGYTIYNRLRISALPLNITQRR